MGRPPPPPPHPPQPHPKRPVQQSKVGLSTKSCSVQAGPPSVIDSASRSKPLAQRQSIRQGKQHTEE